MKSMKGMKRKGFGSRVLPFKGSCVSYPTIKGKVAHLEMAPMKAMKAMKSMKGMKRKGKATPSMTASAAYSHVSEKTGVAGKDIRAVMETIMELAGKELKSNGCFKLGGALNMKLKKKKATPKRKGTNPFTGEPCTFKAKPASKTVRVLPMKKLKEMVN